MIKSIFKYLFKFYIEASIHVALAVISLFYIFLIEHKLKFELNIGGVIFFGTITGYNFVKYAPIAKLHHRSLTHFLKGIQCFSLISFIALVYFGFQLPFRSLLIFASGGILIFLYAIPLILKKNLRSLSGIKIYIVGFSWVIAIVIAPAIHYNLLIDYNFFLNCLQVFCLVVALIIPFDIRDLIYDNKNLHTIPQNFGIFKAKIIAVALVIIFFLLEVISQKKPETKIVKGLISLIIIYLVSKTSSNNKKYYCSFYIELTPILMVVFLLII